MKQAMSFVCGTSHQPLMYQTIGDVFDTAVERWGEKEAIFVRHQQIRWSYRQLAVAVESFAAGLLLRSLIVISDVPVKGMYRLK